MARSEKSSGNKKTSFGKKTNAEKSFRDNKKSRSGRGERSEKPSGERRFSSARKSSAPRFERDSSRGEGRSSFGAKSRSERPFDKKRSGGSFKREDSAPRENRFSRSNFSKPRFDKPGSEARSFEKGDGERPFKSKRSGFKRDSEGGAPRESKFPRSGNFSKPRFENDSPRGEGSFREGGKSKSFGRKKDDRFGGGEKKFSKPFEKRSEGAGRFSKFKKEDGERPEKSFERKEFKKSFSPARSFTSRKAERPNKSEASPATEKSEDGLIRLNKFMANSGVGSRRESDEYIKMGLVTVNGETITEMGYKVKPTDDVRYEGRKLKAEPLVYILLNKPKGFITTSDDPEERKTVMDLVANACKERIYPVGRLDRNTTGLLLFTNDGDLADKLTHPSYNAKKIYKVELDRALTKNDFQKILDGVYLEEGRVIVDDLAMVSDNDKEVGIEIHIGWNRIVRRLFEALGYQIVKLDRVVYAGLDKKDLGRGQWRFLKPEEVVRLKHFQG
ncbi:MAG: rRNA pseudouridine synthase [Bacteroidetes bacterium]|nr:rRNA pseudouridine synthase [Bacteroidota bacterium]